MDDESKELALVHEAICDTTSNVLYFYSGVTRKMRADRDLDGLDPNEAKKLLQAHVRANGVSAISRKPKHPEDDWEKDFNFHILFPVPGFPRDLFVKVILADESEGCPEVSIVSVHLTFPK